MSTTPKIHRTTHTPGPWSADPTDAELISELRELEESAGNFHYVRAIDRILTVGEVNAAMHQALRKVPLFGLTDDGLGWRCAGCGAISGVDPDGKDIEETCAPDCYVPIVEEAIQKAEGK